MASQLQNDIRDFLKPFCKWTYITTAGRLPGSRYRLAPKGFPDIMAMTKRGRIMFIEVKTGKEPISDEQIHFIEWHRVLHGYFAIVARSVDDVENAMREKGWIK